MKSAVYASKPTGAIAPVGGNFECSLSLE